MARPQATPEQREAVRRGVRKAAAEIYRAEGISAISARSVAKKAGVSVGTIYAHFGNLTGLMQSLWTGRVERLNEDLKSLAGRYEDPLERLRALLTAYLGFGVENADLYRGAFLFVRPESLDKPDAEPMASAGFPGLLIDALREGQSAGTIIKGDPARLAQILWSGAHGCLALPVNIDRLAFAPVQEIAEPMADALIRAVEARAG